MRLLPGIGNTFCGCNQTNTFRFVTLLYLFYFYFCLCLCLCLCGELHKLQWNCFFFFIYIVTMKYWIHSYHCGWFILFVFWLICWISKMGFDSSRYNTSLFALVPCNTFIHTPQFNGTILNVFVWNHSRIVNCLSMLFACTENRINGIPFKHFDS